MVLSPQLKGENSASLSPWSIPYAALGSMLPTGGIGGDEKAHEIPNGNCLALSLSIFQVPIELQAGGRNDEGEGRYSLSYVRIQVGHQIWSRTRGQIQKAQTTRKFFPEN